MPPPLPPLTPQEIASFVRDGYLIKRRVLDPALCAQARDVLWAHNEAPHKLRRGDPSTYFGPWDYKDEQRDGDNVRKHYRWHLHKVGNDQLFVDLVGGATHKYAEQLLGVGECTPPRGSGGIYCIGGGDTASRAWDTFELFSPSAGGGAQVNWTVSGKQMQVRTVPLMAAE